MGNFSYPITQFPNDPMLLSRAHVGAGLCIGIGGVRVDKAIALACLDAVSDRAVEAAIFASDQVARSTNDIIAAIERDLERPFLRLKTLFQPQSGEATAVFARGQSQFAAAHRQRMAPSQRLP